MSSAEFLREFISQRLSAAAEEIFTVCRNTIIQYEEEIDRQHRLLDIFRKPQVKLHRIDFPQQHVCKEEEVLTDQQFCDQEGNSSLDQEEPEPTQIKEEQEELCTSQEGEQFGLKQEINTFIVTRIYEGSDDSESEPNSDQLFSYNPPVFESQDQERSDHIDSGPSRNAEVKPKKRHDTTQNPSHSNDADNSPMFQFGTDTGKKLVQCEVCLKTFKSKYQLNLHLRIHTGERPYTCNICGRNFTRHDNLTVHMRTHTGEKPFSCNTCGKNFLRNDSLNVHMRIHTGEKPYSCNTCGKRFTYMPYLKIHMRTHTGEKPYICKFCGTGFNNLSTLKTHERVHTGEKPYSCKICGKRFSQSCHLLRHMRTHTEEEIKNPPTSVREDCMGSQV